MGITTNTDEKVLSELKLMAQVGATPVECVTALKGKMSRSSVYKFYNKFKVQAHYEAIDSAEEETEDKCLECDTELAPQINEIAAKNEELQKELHTSKNFIGTLQNGINELNEAITESKIAIAEVCKERDDKAEEIRVLKLELQKYKNDLNSVLDDRQKLECLLSDNANVVEKESAVEHPKHYNNIAGIECLDVVEHFNFNRGNSIKYIWRAGEKSKEKEVEDLKKAVFYLEREIKNLQEEK